MVPEGSPFGKLLSFFASMTILRPNSVTVVVMSPTFRVSRPLPGIDPITPPVFVISSDSRFVLTADDYFCEINFKFLAFFSNDS